EKVSASSAIAAAMACSRFWRIDGKDLSGWGKCAMFMLGPPWIVLGLLWGCPCFGSLSPPARETVLRLAITVAGLDVFILPPRLPTRRRVRRDLSPSIVMCGGELPRHAFFN